uniref:FH2 domain-containing protein n=1 Tax=Globodera pallida TaxID=36090 RepID=A0A183CLE4_GLOPA
MVALCSGSSASSPVESSPSLDIIIEDQQQHFLRLAFGTNMMDLLNNMLLNSFNRGNFAVIEQLWCWQDPNECPHSLSLLLGELRSTRHFSVAVAVVRLLARLFRLASDQVTKQRLRNQMEALRFDDAVLSLRNRFRLYSLTTDSAAVPSSFGVLLEEAIEDWMMMMMHAKAEENGEDATTSRTDADSGTFSGDEEESKQQQQQQQLMVTGGKKEDEHKDGQLDAVVRLIHTLPAHEVPLLAQLLRTFAASNRSLITLISSIPLDNRLQSRQCGAGTPPPLASPLLSPASVCPRSSSFPPAPPPPPPVSLVRPPPPPLSSPSTCRGPNQQTADIPSALRPKVLPDQCRRLRHLQWTKLPTNAIAASAASANVWQTMEAVDQEMRDHLDFTVLDAFFGCPSNTPQNISDISCRSAPSSARRRSSMMLNGGDCVTLLDSKRSLSVNVFLKMCRDSDQLLKDLADGKADKIGADRLRTISHLLPSAEEQKILRDFSGDKQMLGAAEQFLLALTERIPAHRLRLEAMLFKLDLEGMLDTNRPNDGGLGLKVWLNGCQELLSSGTLRKVLYALLHLGNYLNHGAGSGNAVGFRLSSLWKVEDVKTIGGTRGRTLLHFVAQQVGNCAQALATELANVRESAKSSLEAISDDVRGLLERMHCLEEGISRTIFVSNAGGDAFLEDFLNFLKKSRHIIALAERQLAELSTLRRSVATFLCEQEQNFSLEECFKVIAWFITRFEKAVEENRRFVERDQQQMDAAQQFRKLPESFNGMALKCVVKRTRQESGRQSFALVDERERQQQTPCGSSSPGKVRRRRTAHSVTPLLDGRQFLNGLEEVGQMGRSTQVWEPRSNPRVRMVDQ